MIAGASGSEVSASFPLPDFAFARDEKMTPAARKHGRFVKAVFRTPAAMADEAAGLLVARGALGCAVAQSFRPGAKPPKVVSLEAFFTRLNQSQLAGLTRQLRSAGMLAGDARGPRANTIADPGWSALWMSRFKPIRIGRRILIVPPWRIEHDSGRSNRIVLIIKPARAFGTGHHPTTAGVLRVLEKLCTARRFLSALDVGTGSGILAIAMKLLGVQNLSAIDIDPDALENARENAKLNHLEAGLEFSSIALNTIRRRYDLIVANILASTLIEMAPVLTRLLARDGRLILAGILAREAGEVLRRYRPALRCVSISRDHGWATMVLAR